MPPHRRKFHPVFGLYESCPTWVTATTAITTTTTAATTAGNSVSPTPQAGAGASSGDAGGERAERSPARDVPGSHHGHRHGGQPRLGSTGIRDPKLGRQRGGRPLERQDVQVEDKALPLRHPERTWRQRGGGHEAGGREGDAARGIYGRAGHPGHEGACAAEEAPVREADPARLHGGRRLRRQGQRAGAPAPAALHLHRGAEQHGAVVQARQGSQVSLPHGQGAQRPPAANPNALPQTQDAPKARLGSSPGVAQQVRCPVRHQLSEPSHLHVRHVSDGRRTLCAARTIRDRQ